MYLIKKKAKFLIFIKILTFILLSWICQNYKNCTYDKSLDKHHLVDITIDLLNVKLLGKTNHENYSKNSIYKGKLLNGRKTRILENEEEYIFEKNEKGKSKKEKTNKFKDELGDTCELVNMKDHKLYRKNKCSMFKPFKIVDTYFEKRLFRLLRAIFNYGSSIKGEKKISKHAKLVKIGLIFVFSAIVSTFPYILHLGSLNPFVSYILCGIGALFLVYIFMKLIICACVDSRNRKLTTSKNIKK
ncbi:Protein of unknown function, putative [Plasmodium ovale]|uniref:Uncharacterized protein n=1 Tax=Plasmodium ovale TaxID=36330 RepID=A0A1C3KI26_PLAOA|nr:Protein of unknown function, putative [Plasmodium ovale]